MSFRAERTDGHCRGVKAFKQFSGRLNVVNADGFITRVQRQQVAQRRRRTAVHQFSILLVIAVLAALNGLLQRTHHVRVISVIFTAVDILQQATLIQRLTCQPGAFRQVHQILLEVSESGTADTADNTLEAKCRHVVMQTDRFKQLRAAVGGDGRDAHFGHDFVQAFVDAVTVVQHHRAVIFVDSTGIHETRQRFVGQVRVNSRRTKA